MNDVTKTVHSGADVQDSVQLATGDVSRTMPTVARLYTQGRYRRASVKPGPGRALVLREDAEREAREAYAAGVHAGRAERDHLHTEYSANIGIANNGEGRP